MMLWIRRFLLLLVILSPAILSIVLLQVARGQWLTEAYPFWSDEIWYWHEAQSFAQVGLNSGYYTVKEIPAPLGFSHFNAWGIFIPMFYGIFAKLFGWSLSSMVILNLVFLTAAVALLLYAMRPTIEQLLMLLALLLSYSPIWLYSFTSMLPMMQMGIGIALAAGFIVVSREREKTPRKVWIALAIGIALAGLERLTWTILYLPLILLLAPRITAKRIAAAFTLTGIAFLTATALLVLTAGHYPNFFGQVLAAFRQDIPEGFSLLWQNITTNINLWDEGDTFEIYFRQIILLMLGLLLAFGGYFFWKKREGINAVALCLYMLAAYCVLTIVIYDVKLSRDFRLFAPIVLFVLVIAIAYRWRLLLAPIFIGFLLMLPSTWHVYNIWVEWHLDPAGRNAYYAWGTEFAKVIEYEPDAANPWCNTLLHSHLYLWTQTSIVMSMPTGIGLSTTFEQADMPPPYQARWLMLTDEEFAQWEDELDVEVLMIVPFGKLYRNNASACP